MCSCSKKANCILGCVSKSVGSRSGKVILQLHGTCEAAFGVLYPVIQFWAPQGEIDAEE